MHNNWDVVIVGGGLAGFVVANFLSRSTLSVLLIERSKRVGGRAKTDNIKKNYFNAGPHALYKGGRAVPILEQLNIKIEGQSPKTSGLLVEEGAFYEAPFSPQGLLTSSYFSWKERIEWLKTLKALTKTTPDLLKDTTFQQWVEQATSNKKVQSLLFTLGRLATYCHSPEKSSAYVIVSHMKCALRGVIYQDRGWQTIIDQLHNKAIMAGVHVQTQVALKQFARHNNGSFRIDLSNGEVIHGKNLLYTGEPSELNYLIEEKEVEPINSAIQNRTPVKAAVLDVALKKLPNEKRLFAMGVTAPFYYSVHSKYASLSEDGQSNVLHVLKYHQLDERINSSAVQEELEQFLEMIQPGWKKHEITSRYLPQIIVNQRLPQLGDESELIRSETKIHGLYIAGDWASPHSILAEGAVCSGKQAAEEIIQKEMR
ncbi:phytoene desaturase family protein [Evansella halocellulosilytica]|uniref:phytoene desaturase family protein n=1 Tax=Evansella halocellulosilytica TaxID=2011013 RepID=UPI000BB9A511|nr:FAD-dependent oxidoreductase [Evansella halocellulosilytica]